MDKKAIILGSVTLIVGLVICFVGPRLVEDPTMICMIGSIISFVGTQTVAQVILGNQNNKDD